MSNISRISSLVSELVSVDPSDPSVVELTDKLASALSPAVETESVDADVLFEQVKQLHNASVVPAKNYARIASITAGLARVVDIARRPQNAELRPRVAQIVSKLAGIFAECDTADALSEHSLKEIEEAVHKLYSNGALNKPSTYNFEARGKGFHGKT